MNVNKKLLRSCLIATLAVGTAGGLVAQDQNKDRTTTDRNAPATQTTKTTAGAPDKANKASGLIGMNVRNQTDEKLGDIKDIVVDLQSGKVSYAVLDGGGVFQDKLFAVPMTAFTTSSDRSYLVLNANKARMETAKGFDKNTWPNVSNPDFGSEPFWEKKAGLDDLPDVPGLTTSRTGAPEKLNKASGLIGTAVRNQSNEKLGDIKDLVIDLNSGKVSYAVLDAGGIIKDKMFAVPLSAFIPGNDRNTLVLNADKQRLENSKGFDRNSWPAVSNPDFGAGKFWDDKGLEIKVNDRGIDVNRGTDNRPVPANPERKTPEPRRP